MGLYDRDYMQEGPRRRPEPPSAPRPRVRDPVEKAPLWARIKFRLWLLFRRR